MFEYLFDEKDDRRFQIVLSLNKLSRVDPKSWFDPRYNLKLESNFRLSWFEQSDWLLKKFQPIRVLNN